MSGLENFLKEMEPQIKGCIKKYSYKIDKMYTYEDLLHEGYTTIISAMKQWDGINNKTSLKQFIWMKLEWHFKSLAEEEFGNNYQTDFIEEFEKDLAETDFSESLQSYFNVQKNPEQQLLEKLTSPHQYDLDFDLFSLIEDVLPERLKNYINLLKQDILEVDIIARKLDCTPQNVISLKNDLIKFIKNFDFQALEN